MVDELLRVNDLQTYFFTPEGVVKAVDRVSFDLPKGRTLGILGESGCGKSVTALSIMRLIDDPPGRIIGGSIHFENEDLLELPPAEMRTIRGNQISMIFQEPMTSLNPVYTVGNQIGEVYITHRGLNERDARDQTIEILRLVGIPGPGAKGS